MFIYKKKHKFCNYLITTSFGIVFFLLFVIKTLGFLFTNVRMLVHINARMSNQHCVVKKREKLCFFFKKNTSFLLLLYQQKESYVFFLKKTHIFELLFYQKCKERVPLFCFFLLHVFNKHEISVTENRFFVQKCTNVGAHTRSNVTNIVSLKKREKLCFFLIKNTSF